MPLKRSQSQLLRYLGCSLRLRQVLFVQNTNSGTSRISPSSRTLLIHRERPRSCLDRYCPRRGSDRSFPGSSGVGVFEALPPLILSNLNAGRRSLSLVTSTTRHDSFGPDEATDHASFHRRQAVHHLRLRYHVGDFSESAQWSRPVACRLWWKSGHPQPPHRDGHPCAVDVLPGPTGVI